MDQLFCPTCGTPLVTRPSSSGGPLRRVCPGCRATVYDAPSLVVATLPVVADRVVLVRRATPPGRGLWAYPGGYLETGETLEEGAARETLEEAGIEVQVTGLLGVYSRPGGRSVTVVFEAMAADDDGRPGPEVTEVRSFAPGEIPWGELAFWSVTYALEDWVYARERGLALPRAWRIGPARR